jgi:type II secretory pathway predicted ATPase ExeA
MTMYLEHFGLREAPFRITPHTEFFFSGANRGATLEALLYAITAGEGMVKVTGEVGSGKTMLCRVLMERLPETVETIYLAVPSLSRDEMLAAIANELGIDTTGANTTRLIRSLQDKLIEVHATGHRVVALIDEAHAMPLATLEEIRLLSNLETGTEKLLQIVLFGQPELDAHLALPHMRQLKERITHGFNLAPLPPRDVKDYLNFRLRAAGYHGPDLFNAEVLRIINEASEGLTRRINIYADKTLLAAFAAGTHSLTPDHARAAVTDTQIVFTRAASPRRLALAVASGVVAGIAIGFTLAQFVTWPYPGSAVAASSPLAKPVAPIAAAIPVASLGVVPTTMAANGAQKAGSDRPARGLAARIAAGRDLLASDSQAYAVQLLVTDARERAYLESYLADAGRALRPDQLYVVPAGGPESPRLALLFGAFDDRVEAFSALASLPEGLKQFRPYVRPLDAVREDARRAERN